MYKLLTLIVLGSASFVFANESHEGSYLAYVSSPTPDEPKIYHNQPGFSGTSDEEIENKIREVLKAGWLSQGVEDVAFEVKDGNVILRGSVETLTYKAKIEDSIKKVDGVNQIKNELIIIKKTVH